MATLKSSKLREALQKARNVGRAEESVVIDGCSIVLQSLSASEYEDVIQSNSDLEGSAYVRAHQLGHVCRSIVEIEGVDLREVTVVEADVPSGDYLINFTVPTEAKAGKIRESLKALGVSATVVAPEGEDRTVLIEKHAWLQQQLETWSQEAVSVAYRKFLEVVVAGDERAKAQVQFKIPDETTEDKYRRLLSEAKELEGDLPPDLANRVLDDVGYLHKSTPAELAEVAERAREFAEEQKKKAEAASAEEPEPEEEPVAQPSEPPMDLMRNRQRLNQLPVSAPVQTAPPSPAQPARAPVQFAAARPGSRAEEIAALEADVDPNISQGLPGNVRVPTEVAELSRPMAARDASAVRTIIDQPPQGGLNPRFKARPSV